MPAYRNRPLMDPDTPVWRYLSLDALIATVQDRQLRFTRVDTFADPFEGSVPKQQIDDQVALFAGAYQMRMMYGSVAAHYPAGAMSLPRMGGLGGPLGENDAPATRKDPIHACVLLGGRR